MGFSDFQFSGQSSPVIESNMLTSNSGLVLKIDCPKKRMKLLFLECDNFPRDPKNSFSFFYKFL